MPGDDLDDDIVVQLLFSLGSVEVICRNFPFFLGPCHSFIDRLFVDAQGHILHFHIRVADVHCPPGGKVTNEKRL